MRGLQIEFEGQMPQGSQSEKGDSFEKNLERLEKIVSQLEAIDLPLERPYSSTKKACNFLRPVRSNSMKQRDVLRSSRNERVAGWRRSLFQSKMKIRNRGRGLRQWLGEYFGNLLPAQGSN